MPNISNWNVTIKIYRINLNYIIQSKNESLLDLDKGNFLILYVVSLFRVAIWDMGLRTRISLWSIGQVSFHIRYS